MIRKKLVLGLYAATVFCTCVFSNAFAYNPENHDSRFFAGFFQQSSIINSNQNIEKPAPKSSDYSISLIGGGATIGYRLKPNVMIEAEGLFSSGNNIAFDNTIDGADYTGKMTYMSAMANAYYHQYISDFFSVYLGMGVGVSNMVFDDVKKDVIESKVSSKAAFSTHLKYGVSLTKISEKFIPYFGYKFLHVAGGNIKMGGQNYNGSFNAHNIQFGGIIPTSSN